MHQLQRFERMLVHRFAIVLLLLFDIASSVKAGGCFAPDTTWAADINQGITNITTKVVFFLPTNCQSNLGSRRRNVRQFAKNPLLVKDSPISMEKPLPMPTSAQPSPQSAHHLSPAPAVWADPAHAYAQVHISKEDIYVENSNQLNARCSYIHLFSWLNRRPLYTAIVCRGVKRNFKRTFTFNLKFT